MQEGARRSRKEQRGLGSSRKDHVKSKKIREEPMEENKGGKKLESSSRWDPDRGAGGIT